MRTALGIVFALLATACAVRRPDVASPTPPPAWNSTGPRVLGVIAHPDDETAFAATLFKISSYLHGECDLVVITNGEAGFKYATLAESIYGADLTDERVGRAQLPEIRRREMLDSAAVLGVHGVRFLGELDQRYTTDLDELLGPNAKVWDLARVRRELDLVLDQGRYDFVFALRPSPTTHAGHQAATALAAEAVLQRPEGLRPVMLVAQVVEHAEASPLEFAAADGGLVVGPFVFDRTQSFGFQGKLDYRIVVNWAIAAHKSQGTMQLAAGRGEREEFFLFGEQRLEGARKAAALFERLREPQFRERTYGESAGVRASSR